MNVLEQLLYLETLWLLLFVGLFGLFLARRFRFENIFLLLGLGFVLQQTRVLLFSTVFLRTVVILLFTILLFDKVSRIKPALFNSLDSKALLISVILMVVSGAVIGPLIYILFDLPLLICIVIGMVLSSSALHFHKHHYLSSLLEKESIYSNALTLIVAVLTVILIRHSYYSFSYFQSQLLPFFETLFMSVGLGLVIGLLFFRGIYHIVKRVDSAQAHSYRIKRYNAYYFVLIMGSLLVTAITARYVNANPFLTIATISFIFGYYFVKNREELEEFPRSIILFTEIAVFMLLGFLIRIPADYRFYLIVFYLYFMYLVIRYLVIYLLLRDIHSFGERMFITLNNPKSLTTAGIILFFVFMVNGMALVAAILFTIMVYSLMISLITSLFAKRIRLEIDYTEQNFEHKRLKDIKREAKLNLNWFRRKTQDTPLMKKGILKSMRREKEFMSDAQSQYDLSELDRKKKRSTKEKNKHTSGRSTKKPSSRKKNRKLNSEVRTSQEQISSHTKKKKSRSPKKATKSKTSKK